MNATIGKGCDIERMFDQRRTDNPTRDCSRVLPHKAVSNDRNTTYPTPSQNNSDHSNRSPNPATHNDPHTTAASSPAAAERPSRKPSTRIGSGAGEGTSGWGRVFIAPQTISDAVSLVCGWGVVSNGFDSNVRVVVLFQNVCSFIEQVFVCRTCVRLSNRCSGIEQVFLCRTSVLLAEQMFVRRT